MARDCQECVKNIVELHDGWIATQVQRDIWKLENPSKEIGIGVFTSLQQIRDYLKEEQFYD